MAPAAASASTISAPFSPIMTAAALVLPETTVGMIDASITRRRVENAHAQGLLDDGSQIGRVYRNARIGRG